MKKTVSRSGKRQTEVYQAHIWLLRVIYLVSWIVSTSYYKWTANGFEGNHKISFFRLRSPSSEL